MFDGSDEISPMYKETQFLLHVLQQKGGRTIVSHHPTTSERGTGG